MTSELRQAIAWWGAFHSVPWQWQHWPAMEINLAHAYHPFEEFEPITIGQVLEDEPGKAFISVMAFVYNFTNPLAP